MGNIVQCRKKEDTIETPKMPNLSPEQIQMIKSSWAIPSAKPFDSGERVLYFYFDRFPHNQEKFQAFKNTPILLLKGTPGFRAHASRIMNVLSSIVDSLDKDPELIAIKKIIAEFGKSHARRQIPKQSFVELREVLLDVLSEVCHLDSEGKLAWIQFLDLLHNVLFPCLDGNFDQFLK